MSYRRASINVNLVQKINNGDELGGRSASVVVHYHYSLYIYIQDFDVSFDVDATSLHVY